MTEPRQSPALAAPQHGGPWRWLATLPGLARVGLAVLIGGLCWWFAPTPLRPGTRVIAAWDGFSGPLLLLTWAVIATADAARIRQVATAEDPGRTWTFVVTVMANATCLLAVGLLQSGLKQMERSEQFEHLLLSVAAVTGAWLLLHTLFTLRYAHVYFSEDRTTSPPDRLGGLEFCGAPPTTYWDFAYFAFVIGMTAQTADIAVSSLRMRQLVLLHGLLSFGFNTAIVALSINILSGII